MWLLGNKLHPEVHQEQKNQLPPIHHPGGRPEVPVHQGEALLLLRNQPGIQCQTAAIQEVQENNGALRECQQKLYRPEMARAEVLQHQEESLSSPKHLSLKFRLFSSLLDKQQVGSSTFVNSKHLAKRMSGSNFYPIFSWRIVFVACK